MNTHKLNLATDIKTTYKEEEIFNKEWNIEYALTSFVDVPDWNTSGEMRAYFNKKFPEHDTHFKVYCYLVAMSLYDEYNRISEIKFATKNVIGGLDSVKLNKRAMDKILRKISDFEYYVNKRSGILGFYDYFVKAWRILYIRAKSFKQNKPYYYNHGTFKKMCERFEINPARVRKYSYLAIMLEYAFLWKSVLVKKEKNNSVYTIEDFWKEYQMFIGKEYEYISYLSTNPNIISCIKPKKMQFVLEDEQLIVKDKRKTMSTFVETKKKKFNKNDFGPKQPLEKLNVIKPELKVTSKVNDVVSNKKSTLEIKSSNDVTISKKSDDIKTNDSWDVPIGKQTGKEIFENTALLQDYAVEILVWSQRLKLLWRSFKDLRNVKSVRGFILWYLDTLLTNCTDRKVARTFLSSLNFGIYSLFVRDMLRVLQEEDPQRQEEVLNKNFANLKNPESFKEYASIDFDRNWLAALLPEYMLGTSVPRSVIDPTVEASEMEENIRREGIHSKSRINNTRLYREMVKDRINRMNDLKKARFFSFVEQYRIEDRNRFFDDPQVTISDIPISDKYGSCSIAEYEAFTYELSREEKLGDDQELKVRLDPIVENADGEEEKQDVNMFSGSIFEEIETEYGKQTGLFDVFDKIQGSQFNKELLGFISAIQFSGLMISVADKVNIKPGLIAITEAYKEFMNLATLKKDVSKLWKIFIEEILPAVVHGDLSKITPAGFGHRVDIINSAISAGNVRDIFMMKEVIQRWNMPNERNVLDDEVYSIFYDTLKEMIEFVTKCIDTKQSVNFKQLNGALNALAVSIRQDLIYGLTRVTPFSIGLYGPAGSGKTSIVNEITNHIYDVLGISLVKNKDGQLVAQKCVNITDTQSFMDNINNSTEVILFDDIGTALPEKVKPGETAHSTFMRIQGSTPFPIPRADISNKNGQFFNNKLTYLTSNQKDYGNTFYVRDEKAFMRRVHCHVELNGNRLDGHFGKVEWIDWTKADIVRNTTTFGSTTELLDILREQAILYVRCRERHAENLSTYICATCKRSFPRYCECNRQVVEPQVNGFIFDTISKDLDPHQIALLIVWEELFYYASYSIAASCANPLVATILISCMREYVEGCNLYRFIYFLFVTIFYILPYMFNTHLLLIFPILSHFIFDHELLIQVKDEEEKPVISIIIEDGKVLYRDKVYQKIKNFCETVIAHCYPRFYLEKLKVKIATESIIKSLSTEALALLFGSVGMGAAFMYYVYNVAPKVIQTSIGQQATEEDEMISDMLDKAVDGHYDGRVDGLSNSYPLPVSSIVRKSNGNIPRTLANNIITVKVKTDDRVMKGVGYFCNNNIYFNRHLIIGSISEIRDRIAKNEEFHVQYFFNNNPSYILNNAITQSSVVNIYDKDIISIPCGESRRSVNYIGEYIFDKEDQVLIGDMKDPVKVLRVMGAFKSEDVKGRLHDEPEGSILIQYNNKAGESGTPVFLVKRKNVHVEPSFIGILSANYGGNAVMVTIPTLKAKQTSGTMNYDILSKDLTHDHLRDYFAKNGKVIKDDISPRSDLLHIPDICNIGDHVGHIDRWNNATPSNFYKTELFDRAAILIPETKNYTIPNLTRRVEDGVYVSHMLACYRQMNNIGRVHNESPFWSAAEIAYKDIHEIIGNQLYKWKPLTLNQVIRGTALTNPINLKSSLGFPFQGMIKDDIFAGSYEKPVLKAWFGRRMLNILEEMDQGKLPFNISTTAIKDEIVKKGKLSRIFFAGCTEFLLLCRMYLAPIMEIFMASRDKLPPKIGMNAIGPEFHEMLTAMYDHIYRNASDTERKKMENIGVDRLWIDGDYSKYDKVLLTLRYAIHVVYWLALSCEHFQENQRDLNRLILILKSLQQYVVILGQDIFIFDDKIPSGVWATALLNCLCELIIEIVQFYWLIQKDNNTKFINFVNHYKGVSFKSNISLANYGDDNLKCINPSYIRLYVHDDIMAFARWICMPMTPSRKEETTIFPKLVTEILFLKRVPKFNDVLSRYVGCLELGSIGKMLGFTDSYASEWKQAVLNQARRELSFHNEKIYYEFLDLFGLPKVPITETLVEIDHLQWGTTEIDLVSEETHRAVSGFVEYKIDINSDREKMSLTSLDSKDRSEIVAQQTAIEEEAYVLDEDQVDQYLPPLEFYKRVLMIKINRHRVNMRYHFYDEYLVKQIIDLTKLVQNLTTEALSEVAIQAIDED